MDHLSKEEAIKELESLGYQPRVTEYPWRKRLKCRLFGPHEWVSVMRMTREGALVEEGMICDVCHKETV
jgi:hypothetical protein